MSMVNLVSCIFSLFWSTYWCFWSTIFFRASFLHLTKDTDCKKSRAMQLNFLKWKHCWTMRLIVNLLLLLWMIWNIGITWNIGIKTRAVLSFLLFTFVFSLHSNYDYTIILFSLLFILLRSKDLKTLTNLHVCFSWHLLFLFFHFSTCFYY